MDKWEKLKKFLEDHIKNGDYIISIAKEHCPEMLEQIKNKIHFEDMRVREILDKMAELEKD